jgi:hypothetical protein
VIRRGSGEHFCQNKVVLPFQIIFECMRFRIGMQFLNVNAQAYECNSFVAAQRWSSIELNIPTKRMRRRSHGGTGVVRAHRIRGWAMEMGGFSPTLILGFFLHRYEGGRRSFNKVSSLSTLPSITWLHIIKLLSCQV